MTLNLPDIDIETASLEELKAAALIYADADNKIRNVEMNIAARIISLQHEFTIDLPDGRRKVYGRGQKVRKFVAESFDEDETSIEDFK